MPTHLNKKLLRALSILPLVAISLIGYGYFIEPRRLVVNSSELGVSKWSPAFDGLKIVAIADIHGGSNGVDESKIRQVVEIANAQDADIIVLLGDYVAEEGRRGPTGKRQLRMPIETIATNLEGLKSRLGVFAVLGNHDGWHDDSAISSALTARGIRVLDGQVATIERNGQLLRILGLRDHQKITSWEAYNAEAKQLLQPTDGKGDILVLQHSPDVAVIINGTEPISPDLRLMIAGHTHGGQVWLPVLGRPIVPSSYGQRFAAGHARENGMDVFVTTGVGTSILPFRFMVPPEIAVLTIRSK